MALIKCPNCGKQYSEHAEKCPQCGLTLKEANDKVEEKREEKRERAESLKQKIKSILPYVLIIGAILALAPIIEKSLNYIGPKHKSVVIDDTEKKNNNQTKTDEVVGKETRKPEIVIRETQESRLESQVSNDNVKKDASAKSDNINGTAKKEITVASSQEAPNEITSKGNNSNVEAKKKEGISYNELTVKPSFDGGDANQFAIWVNSQLQYPERAKEEGIFGRVLLQFRINEDGSVSDIKVVRGVDPDLDKEAVRVVSHSPKWKPGEYEGEIVPVTYTFPIIFQLR